MKKLNNKTLEKKNIGTKKNEEFRQIPGWRNYYISNYGRLLRKRNNCYREVSPSCLTNGYLAYTLSKPARRYRGQKVKRNGKTKTIRQTTTAQRLVALMFNINYYDDTNFSELEVHHKDGNRKNNYYKNLLLLRKQEHKFMDKIEKITLFNENTGKFRTTDIEIIAKKLNLNVIEIIRALMVQECLYLSDNYEIYNIVGGFIGVKKKREKVNR